MDSGGGRRQRGFKFSAGDWTCSNGSCRNVNFARRDRCNLCDKERDSRGGGGGGSFGGGSFGGGSFGGGGGGSFRDEGRGRGRGGRGGSGGGRGGNSLFAPEDWDCSKCGNVNWARRDRCFRCDAPKGMGGGGGGDRGRSYDDDEIGYMPDRNGPFDDDYDDFKRRPSEKPYGQRPLFQEDECGPMDYPSMRNGSRFEGSRGRGGGGGGFRGRGGSSGGRGRGGGGGFRGRGGGFRGRDRSRSPLDNRF